MDYSLFSLDVVDCRSPDIRGVGDDRISYACTSSSTVRFAATVVHLIVLCAVVSAAVLVAEIMFRLVEQWRAASLATAGAATAQRAGCAVPSRAATCAADPSFIAAGALAIGCARDECARVLEIAREEAWRMSVRKRGDGAEADATSVRRRRRAVARGKGSRQRSASLEALTPALLCADAETAASIRARLVAESGEMSTRARAFERLSAAALGSLITAAAEGTQDLDDLLDAF